MVDKKMRDGKMIPDKSYKQGWLEIFGKNKKENKKKDEQENKTSNTK